MSVSDIGRRLKNARLNSGMTQAEVAHKLGVTYQAISSYERGITRVDTETLSKLCQIYKISITSILTTAAWNEDMFATYKNASSDTERLHYFDLWGIPAELIEEANTIREPDPHPLTALDEAILYVYHHASDDDRAIIDNIVRRYIADVGKKSSSDLAADIQRITLEAEADEFAAQAREQFLSEKRQALQASSAKKSADGEKAV